MRKAATIKPGQIYQEPSLPYVCRIPMPFPDQSDLAGVPNKALVIWALKAPVGAEVSWGVCLQMLGK